ncbi:non-heme iron oxygenase ferredoxin subunit [Massilia cavernae]|uniref:Non-heme iron oxygenase ferredoxin subunit n=1 Tax=Massilia cavernae TaxID=2320864 RepID=A0A418X704_9BURK|nr:non-heme iron oxygenase ferredoxin subunit [Massilia cavernae]RJG08285.1 non-heme iron oxygenase ferredoxin subunit [Massilia cavernae]
MSAQVTEQQLVQVCTVTDLADGEIFKAEIADLGKFAIYRVGDAFFASDDRCTHAEASLSDEGYLEGFTVVCSWHDGAFDIRTGEVKALPCGKALRTYPVVVREGAVYLTI